MSEASSSRVKFNKKLKFEVGNAKSSKRRSEEDNGVSERGTFKRSSRSNSRDETDGKRGYGVENSDLKRKRVYAERGGEREGDYKNGGVPNRRSFSRKGGFGKDESFRRKSSANDDISDFDRMNRMKFSSSKGRSSLKDEFGEDRSRNKEAGSWRDYKKRTGKGDGKRSFGRENERVGREEAFDGTFKSKVKTRDRWISSSKRDEDEGSPDGKFKSQAKTRERWPSTKRDEVSDSMSKTKGKTRDRWVSTNRNDDEESDSKFKSQAKIRDRWPSTKPDGVSDSNFKTKAKTKDRLVFTKQNDAEDGSQKQHSRDKTDSNRQVDQKSSNRREVGPLEISTKKMLRPKKGTEENPLVDGRRKRKKRKLMGIHPYDISTKRLDDGISIDGNTVEKKVDPGKDVEISMNAQFRAIQPNPSILSFVEDNLLGRRRSMDLRRAGYNIDISAPLDNIPFSTSSERERIEEAVFRNKLDFFAAAKVSSSFPPPELPEIAFAGRSNVGKSSLLNALTRQWGVVRTSDKPGLTQTINFFKLGSKLSMVDLPGYGFAYAKEEVKDAWEELVKEYVSTRVGLKRVCLLIDTKWGMKPRDHELISLMERSQTKYQIVLTKSDTVFPIDVARRAMQIEETLRANKSLVQPVMMVSSKSGGGIGCLRTVLAKIARFAKL